MEACKELAFNFRAPLLEYRRDRSVARMRWETEGAIVATHAHRMANKVGKRQRTWLYSSWMRIAEAERNLETTLADLQQGSSWLNMYEITAKACKEVIPLPHNFAMPKVDPHPSDKKLARIH